MIRSVYFMSAVNIAKAAIQLGINVISARFISPHDYGLVAFSMSFIMFVALLTDLGLSSAIVRHPELDKRQVGAAATVITLFGILLSGLICISAPALSSVANLEGLPSVLMALSISIVFAVSAVAPRALMERHLEYSKIAAIEGAGILAGFAAYLVSIASGLGVMSLVIYQIAMHLVRAITFAVAVRSEIKLNFEWSRIRSLLSFGGWVLLTNALNFLARTSHNILIGIYLGAASLGLYGFANQFMILPLVVLAWPASGVLMSVLSPKGGLTPQSKSSLTLSTMTMTWLVTVPGMFYFTFGAGFLVYHFLDSKWHDAVWLMRVLAPIGAVQSIAAYSGSVILSRGEGSLNFRLSVINTVVFLVAIVVALPFGLRVFVIAYAIAALALAALSLGVIFRRIDATVASLLKSFVPPLVAACLGVGAVWAIFGTEPDTLAAWLKASAVYFVVVMAVYLLCWRSIAAHFTTLRTSLMQPAASAVRE